MSSNERTLSYAEALNEALRQCMAADKDMLLIGQGVKSPWYVGRTCQDLLKLYGPKRVVDTPVSENAVTGAAVGAALAGTRTVVVHPRVDFLMYGLDPVINQAANWHYVFGGRASCPVVFWTIINRGGEQGAQHSQALQALFAHIPGLKVVMPATPYDAKGLMAAAIRDPNPVVYLDDRWLYETEGPVPEELYETPIGRANVLRRGKDISVVASSYVAIEALEAAKTLAAEGLDVEVLDLATIKPMDRASIAASVAKTGRLLAVDGAWRDFGVSAETLAFAAEELFGSLKAAPARLALPNLPAPSAKTQEDAYFIRRAQIAEKIRSMLR